ncbi:hypothetical protein BDZ89DRAFT_1081510 [Hymenopellis radicata]|nr:hypothetical protein BDZ89DRAFT_1081510 [Hymenopellis radicata]
MQSNVLKHLLRQTRGAQSHGPCHCSTSPDSKIAKALPDALNNALAASFSSKVPPEEDAFTKSL